MAIDPKQALANIDPDDLQRYRAQAERFDPEMWERVVLFLRAYGATEQEAIELVNEFRNHG